MPFVEGESLRDKLSREKQLSVAETIEITKGVASALDRAWLRPRRRWPFHHGKNAKRVAAQAGQRRSQLVRGAKAVGTGRLTGSVADASSELRSRAGN